MHFFRAGRFLTFEKKKKHSAHGDGGADCQDKMNCGKQKLIVSARKKIIQDAAQNPMELFIQELP